MSDVETADAPLTAAESPSSTLTSPVGSATVTAFRPPGWRRNLTERRATARVARLVCGRDAAATVGMAYFCLNTAASLTESLEPEG